MLIYLPCFSLCLSLLCTHRYTKTQKPNLIGYSRDTEREFHTCQIPWVFFSPCIYVDILWNLHVRVFIYTKWISIWFCACQAKLCRLKSIIHDLINYTTIDLPFTVNNVLCYFQTAIELFKQNSRLLHEQTEQWELRNHRENNAFIMNFSAFCPQKQCLMSFSSKQAIK